MRKQISSMLLSLALVISILPMSIASEAFAATTVPDGYTGIYTAEDLNNVRNNLSGNYILMNDIDLSSWGEWEPLGDNFNAFSGIFDGQGYAVTGLNINIIEDIANSGLFGRVGVKGTIQNLHVTGNVAGNSHTGGVASENFGTIINCSFAGQITNISNIVGGWDGAAGGVVGGNYGGTVKNCYNIGQIKQYNEGGHITGGVGGVAGSNYGGGSITGCYNAGNISGGKNDVGGIVGINEGYSTIASCYNVGNVSGNRAVGGIVGWNSGVIDKNSQIMITNCYNTGTIYGLGTVGGIAGYIIACEVNSCYSTGNITGSECVGGLIGVIQDSSVENCYYLTGTAAVNIARIYDCIITDVVNKNNTQFASGEVQKLLQSDQEDTIWVQTVGTDPYPLLWWQGKNQSPDISDDESILAVSLSTGNRVSEGTSVTVSWNSISGASRYYISVVNQTAGIYLTRDHILYDTEYRLSTQAQPLSAGEYLISVRAVDNTDGILVESDTVILSVVPTYSFSYDLNGGNGAVPSRKNYETGTVVFITGVTPTKEGYVFFGWTDGINTYHTGDSYVISENDVTLTAVWGSAIDEEVFLKQSHGSSNCTLVAATMMLRQYARLNDMDDWRSITPSAVGNTTSGSSTIYGNGGLQFSFWYRGIYVTCKETGFSGSMSIAEKKAFLIRELEKHPEGIELYRGWRPDCVQQHAVYLTRYDGLTDTFYCADPSPNIRTGEMPLAECSIGKSTEFKGSDKTQDDVLARINQIWLIADAKPVKTLSSSKISAHCPVDMIFTINGQFLDSRTVNATDSNDYATMTVTGTGSDKAITVEINGPYVLEYDVDVELVGNGVGTMTFVVEHTFSDGTTETHTFENVPLSETTTGTASGFYPQSTVLLSLQSSGSDDGEIWASDPNETVTEATRDFVEIPNDDSTIDSDDDNNETTPSQPSPGSSSGSSTTYVPSVDAGRNGDVTVSPSRPSSGQTVTITVDPDEGYALDELTVTDAKGNVVKITDNGDGTYSFRQPSSKVTIEATFTEIQEKPTLVFTDVTARDYYYDPVLWAVENGVTSGTTAATFSPDANVSRAQMVTFLWRAAGSPVPTATVNPFTDVDAGDYFYNAVLWAVGNGITSGTSATTFGPEAAVSRAQAVTFLWRFAGSPAASGISFDDVADESYYAQAVAWAAQEGITSGTGGNNFSPDLIVSRAQAVTFLYRQFG